MHSGVVEAAQEGARVELFRFVTHDLADHVPVAGFLEIGSDHFPRIGIGVGLAEQTGRPETDELVATRFGLEAQLLIMGELVFKGLFAITHAAHIDLPFCAVIVRFGFPINQKGVQSAMQTSAILGLPLMARRFGRKG